MARCLIVGCGCRGRSLAAALQERGHVVRGTTRQPAGLAAIQAAGVEAVLGDPDRIATLVAALDHVSVAVVLLGTAAGSPAEITALHSTRLEMLLTKMIDTTIRGIVYEASGTVDAEVLTAGAGIVSSMCTASRTPYGRISALPGSAGWLDDALGAVDAVFGIA